MFSAGVDYEMAWSRYVLDWTERNRGNLGMGGWYKHDFKVRLYDSVVQQHLFSDGDSELSGTLVSPHGRNTSVVNFLFFPGVSYWRDGEPNHIKHHEDCVEIWDHHWFDRLCGDLRFWICEKVVHLGAEPNQAGL